MSRDFADYPLVYKYRAGFPNYNFVDFGFSDPFVCLDVQTVPCPNCKAMRYYVWREYYKRYEMIDESIANMKARPQPPGYHIQVCFADPARPDQIEAMNMKYAPCMGDMEAKKDFLRGVAEVQRLLRMKECGDGSPHMFFDPGCPNTIYEIQNYAWPKKADLEDNTNESKPQHRNDHALDAIRYGVVHLEVLGARYHLADLARTGDGPELPREYEPRPRRDEFRPGVDTIFSLRGSPVL